ncbi:(2Fe-2S)-binding protein [Synergistales bacterium]|nr:(2Fe-2S)-binding protein [Synergistales bacterium]GHV49613.1 (2Fe-2S)-binding protein [Synergistales bacterium]
MNKDDVIVCRCEEITLEEIREWIGKGYKHFDELKRILRVGMGPCQGRGCRDIILRELSRATGEPLNEICPGTIRPPVKPIKLALCAYGKEDGSK